MSSLRRFDCVSPVAATVILLAAACAGSVPPSDPVIRLVENTENGNSAYVEITGVDRGSVTAARRLTPTSDEWNRIFDVRILSADSPSATAVAGSHAVSGDALRFTPLFPFDAGRQYEVRYNPSGFGSDVAGKTIRKTVARRAAPPAPATYVTQVFPSAPVLPENQLRIYLGSLRLWADVAASIT